MVTIDNKADGNDGDRDDGEDSTLVMVTTTMVRAASTMVRVMRTDKAVRPLRSLGSVIEASATITPNRSTNGACGGGKAMLSQPKHKWSVWRRQGDVITTKALRAPGHSTHEEIDFGCASHYSGLPTDRTLLLGPPDTPLTPSTNQALTPGLRLVDLLERLQATYNQVSNTKVEILGD